MRSIRNGCTNGISNFMASLVLIMVGLANLCVDQVCSAETISSQVAPVGYNKKKSYLVFLGAWGGAIVLGTLIIDFLSSVFGNRRFSLWYDIGTGLLLGARACPMQRHIAT